MVFWQIVQIHKRDVYYCKGDDTKSIKVHYCDLDIKYDEWLDINSPVFRSRVAHAGTMTKSSMIN